MAYVATVDWGTPKRIAQANVLVSWDPASSPETNTVSAAAYVPIGTKAVAGFYRAVSTAANNSISIQETAGQTVSQIFTQVANVIVSGWFEVQLDSSYQFDVTASSANVTDVDVYIVIVYL